MFSERKNYHKRPDKHGFPKNKKFSYRSYRRSSDDTKRTDPENASTSSQDKGKSSSTLSKIINFIILFAVFSSLAYLSYMDTDPVIKLDEKTIPRSQNDYYDAIKKQMSGSLSYKNKLTFNSEKFSQNIKAEFPEIDTVIVEVPVFRHRPTVNITVAEPAARLVTSDKSYILDKEGRALFSEDRINDQFNTSALVSINDASGHPVTLGKPVLTENQINYIREVINQSKANDAPAQTFNLEFGGSAVDVKFKDTNYTVKFSFYEDPKHSSGAYFALRKQIDDGNVPAPADYVDLRIPDRAYLK